MEQAASRSYLSELLGHLERHKRYPYSAQRRREEGIVYLSFAMDRQGRVLSARIHKSSGYGALDSEVEAMIHRADPLPAPPPEIAKDVLRLVVPVRFTLR
jgi:protein TonB